MRLARLLPLLLTLLLTSCLPQQANPPPPNPILTCISEGLEGLQKCLPEIWQAYGWNGVFVLAVCALLLWFFSPSRKILDERLEEWWRSLPLLRGKSPSPPEIERLEEDYLNRALSELQPEDPAAKLDAYLHTLRERETPLKPSEEPLYVPLEGGLAPEELSPTLGLHLGGLAQAPRSWWARLFDRLRPAPLNPEQLFREQRTFENLEEALTATDPNTGQPYPVLALLGEPGAGKSTLMRRFARRQVERRLADPAERLPLFVSLGAHRQGTPLTFLREAWKHMVGFDGLDEALAQGKVWLFADGLNEMPRAGYDLRLAQWRAFLHGEEFSGRGNRALVACRVADYGEGIGAPRLVIHKMDDERIRAFLQKRAPAHAETLWQQLEADRDHGRGDVYALAQTPFWLVMLARLTGSEGLPRNRAALLETFITRWLDYEATRSGGRMLDDACRQAFWEGLTRLARRGLERSQNYVFPRTEAERILTAAQTRLRAADLLTLGRDCTLLDPTSHSVRFQHQLLQEFFAARDLARRFAAGENLRHLWQIPWRRWKFVRSRWDPLPPPPRTGWEEALILAAGLLDPARAEALVRAIQRQNPPLAARCALEAGLRLPEETLNDLRGRLLSDLRNPRQRIAARLEAGRALARLGDPRLLERRRTLPAPKGKETACIEPDWVDIPAGEFQMGTTPEQARAIRRAFGYNPQDEMPAHRVRLGAYRIARWPVTVAEYRLFLEAGGYENDDYWKTPEARRWRDAPLPFEQSYMARYIQFLKANEAQILRQLPELQRRGVLSPAQAEAYFEALRAREDDLRAQWERLEAQKRAAHGRAARPWLWGDEDVQVENGPVVGVTWYEACAYATWLEATLRALGRLPADWQIRLPTEAEWERAARYLPPHPIPPAPLSLSSGERERGMWPWGSRWHPDCANTLEGRVMRPSPVGAFPRGDSPAGLWDMAGNVWEWCLDAYDPQAYQKRPNGVFSPRVQDGDLCLLRGGAWVNNRNHARCACRSRNAPDFFLANAGFRLVCVPSSLSLHSESLRSDSLTPPSPP